MELIKRIISINEDQSGSDSDINELCENEEEFDDINKIKNSDDSENYYNTYHKRKRMRIISDIESKSETKDVDNEENTVKAGFRTWLLYVFYNCF